MASGHRATLAENKNQGDDFPEEHICVNVSIHTLNSHTLNSYIEAAENIMKKHETAENMT